MRYVLLIGSDDKTAPPPAAEMAAIVRTTAPRRGAAHVRQDGRGERLRAPTARPSRVRVKAGQRQVTDGPFTETKEGLGGSHLIECDTGRGPFSCPSPRSPSASCAPSERSATAASPTKCPKGPSCPRGCPAVLAVIYLIFNEGYAAHTGDALVRHELCEEALRLGHTLDELMPDEPEVLGLLALMEPAGLAGGDARGRRRQSRPARGPGSLALGSGADRPRAGPPRSRRLDRARGPVPAPGGHRRLPRARRLLGSDRLAWIVAHYQALVAAPPRRWWS